MANVLVTGGMERSALAVVRSLGRAGHDVDVCSSRSSSLAGASRFARGTWKVPGALEDPAAFAREVADRAHRNVSDVLLPITDADVLAVLRHRSWFPETSIPMPSSQTVERVADKGQVTEAARSVGIEVPIQVRLSSREDLRPEELPPCRFPVVVKPTRSVVSNDRGLANVFVRYAGDRTELITIIESLPDAAFPVLLQERVAGDGFGVFLLVWDDALLAAFAHRRIREKPPSGGASVLRESVPLPPGLLDRSRRLLDAFGWCGVAMIEYKHDTTRDRYVLMEINGRFWGSLQLAIDAGVDFPRLLVRAALGEHVEPILSYRTGVRCRWFWGDVDHLLTRIRHSPAALNLPEAAPPRGTALVDFLRSFTPSTRNEVFRWSDPRPAFHETLDWIARH